MARIEIRDPSGNLVLNPGFENASASPWVQTSSGGYALIDSTRPRTGTKSAYLAGYNNANDTLYQTITVPSNGQLTYWWYMSTASSKKRVLRPDRSSRRCMSLSSIPQKQKNSS